MAADLILAPEAQQDLVEAYNWYERQRPGVGEAFLRSVEACLDGIRRLPEKNAQIHEHYRRGLVRRFPYAVFYEYDSRRVIVYCVFHTSRDPDRWRQRLP